MKNLRHLVRRRVHRERGQPASRQAKGLLEKKSDYINRARVYQKNRDEKNRLLELARSRVPEEFHTNMLNTRMDQNTLRPIDTPPSSADAVASEAKTLSVLQLRKSVDDKHLARMRENLHFIDAKKANSHILFLDSDDNSDGEAGDVGRAKVDVAQMLGTVPELMTQHSNRLTRDQLASVKIPLVPAKTQHAIASQYEALAARRSRVKEIQTAVDTIELRRHLRTKQKRKVTREASGDLLAEVYFYPERKK